MKSRHLVVTISVELYEAICDFQAQHRKHDTNISDSVRYLIAKGLSRPQMAEVPRPGRPRSRT